MMDKLKLQSLMRRLGSIPGLGFLDKWVFEYNQVMTRVGQRKGDLENYVHLMNQAKEEVKGAAGSTRGELDPNYDASGNYVGNDYDEDEFGSVPPPEPTPVRETGPTDALTHNYEDVFYDDGD